MSGAVYLSTVGYGAGALLGRRVEAVEAIHWRDELGLAQAMWVVKANRMGQFIVASDLAGNCLFKRENAWIAANLEKGRHQAGRAETSWRDGRPSNEMIG